MSCKARQGKGEGSGKRRGGKGAGVLEQWTYLEIEGQAGLKLERERALLESPLESNPFAKQQLLFRDHLVCIMAKNLSDTNLAFLVNPFLSF